MDKLWNNSEFLCQITETSKKRFERSGKESSHILVIEGLSQTNYFKKKEAISPQTKSNWRTPLRIIYLSLLPDSEMKALEILGKMSWKYSLFKQMLKEVQESWNQEKILFTVSNGRLRMMVLKWAQS